MGEYSFDFGWSNRQAFDLSVSVFHLLKWEGSI